MLNSGTAQKRARDDTYIVSDQTTTLPEPPSSSAPEASVSEYQPSVLSRTNGNRRISTAKQKAGKQRAAGKENIIFKANMPRDNVPHTPGPRGRNKRTLDDEVSFTKSAPLVRFTSKTGLQEERMTRQFTRKLTEKPVSNE